MDNLFSSQAIQHAKLQGRLNVEKPSLSDADFSSEARKNVDYNPPASSGSHQKQQAETKASQNDEVVKYMSNLPSYLEKGKNLKEKALSVGVLDWRRLEKWQYNHKKMSYQSSKCSPSSSNTSSFFSTDGPSTHSNRGHSCSPGNQRMHQPTLQSHFSSSRKEGRSVGVETTVENVGNFEDLKAASSNPLKGQQSNFEMYQSSSKIQSEINPNQCKRKDSELPNIPEIERSLDLKNCGAVSKSKGKTKIQDSEPTSGLEELHCDVNSNFHQRHKTTLLPWDVPESSRSAADCPYVLAAANGRRSTEASRRSISEGSYPKAVYNAGPYSAILHSCPLPREDDNTQHLQMKHRSSVEAKNNRPSNESLQSPPCSVKMSTNPSRAKKLEAKSSKEINANSAVTKSSGGSNLEKGRVDASKLRDPSPTRRFSVGLGTMGRTTGSRDSSPVPQSSSELVTAKSGSRKIMASSCLENSNNDKPNSTSRSQCSPLRRLLDPLLKPKAVNSSHHSAEPSEKDPRSTVRACKSSNGRVESSAAHFVKLKLDLKSCKTINVDDPYHNEKQRCSTVQALLQLTIKNGLPLFTFTDDNNSDILAATMRKLNASSKADISWIYTFFKFHGVKKRSGWINQGSKGKTHGFVPKVVAQMRVSDAQFPSLVRHNSVDELGIKEFVLFAVDLREADRHISDLQPNDELAAIVVKFPKETPRNLNKDGQQRDEKDNGSSVRNRGCLSTTVILPGGVHGLPSKGEPSSLIERWKSGGLCDCGGWDLGCRIRVLASQTKNSRQSCSSKAHQVADRYELFPQGEVLDDGPVFSLVPFKDGIFSVEFNSSISFLQAFSICIAVLNIQKPHEISELSKVFEEKTFEETTLVAKGGGIKSLTKSNQRFLHRIRPFQLLGGSSFA